MRRRPGVAGWNVEDRILAEEVAWAQKQGHRFSWHDGEILRGREMSDSKRVPQDDVRVVNGAVWSCFLNPGGEAVGGFTGGLWNVAAGWVKLVIGIWKMSVSIHVFRGRDGWPLKLTFRNMHGMSGEACSFPNQRSRLREERRHFSADQLVADRLLAVGVQLVRVGDFPGASGEAIVVSHGLERSGVFGLLRIEAVAVVVLGTSDFRLTASSVYLENSILRSINVGIHPQTEQMLVVVCVDTRINFGAPALGVFSGVHRVGV